MNIVACGREDELRKVFAAGYWPTAAPAELRSHVQSCRECRDWLLVTQGLRGERSVAMRRKPTDQAALIWWRAQLRKRQDAVAQVQRPLRWAQTVSLLVGLVALGWVFYLAGTQWTAAGASLRGSVALADVHPVWLGGCTLLLLAGVAAALSGSVTGLSSRGRE